MKKMEWHGVIPAITTPFNEDLSIDFGFLEQHCKWLVQNGCKGVVALGSLGEGATLTREEKNKVLETCVKAIGNRAFVVAGISSLSTTEAASIAKSAESIGCRGLMVLPPYVYIGDWREMKSHVSTVLSATSLSAMLYNNPIAYTTDFLPAHVHELLQEHANLHAIKESSADIRRVTSLRAIAGDRLRILVGVDDVVVESVYAGAVGWIAGLVNAFPKESVKLFDLAMEGRRAEAFELYRWFLPLLRLDTVPKFVQLIKYVQEAVGMGNQRVRPPRMVLAGEELQGTEQIVAEALAKRPSL
ncbi:MAG TPA: dihydrodipicolinate synthase family protein [Bryobacteraceae bacterium]|nr:dihydrodipicolinate synthase family protein [Bryobacteraceae bacterium]